MASFYPCVKNHASGYTFYVSLISQADTKIAQANPTLAAGDAKIAIDDGAPANLGTLPVVDADFTKRVKVVLSQAETNGDNLTIVFSDAAGAEWCDLTINIQTVPRRFDDLAFPATSGRSMVVDTAGLVDANVVKVGPSGSGTAQTARDVGGQLDAAVSTRAPEAGGNVAAIKAKTDALPLDPADESLVEAAIATRAAPADILVTPANKLATDATGRVTVGTNADKTGYALSAAGVSALWAEVIEGTVSAAAFLRIILAATAGISTDSGKEFYDIAGLKKRIDGTVVGQDRTAVVLDGSP